MKIFNRCVAIMLSIAPVALSAVANFDLINANWGLDNAPIIYYKIDRPARLASNTIKQLRGKFNLRVDVKADELLSLRLSADPTMGTKVKVFEFSPALLQDAVANVTYATDALSKRQNKTAEDKKALEMLQKGAVKATTCYISAQIKSPSDHEILLAPQNPTTQYSKQTAQGLSLQTNVSPLLVNMIEGMVGLTAKLSATEIAFAMKNEIPIFMMQQIDNFHTLLGDMAVVVAGAGPWKTLGNILLTSSTENALRAVRVLIPALSKKETMTILTIKETCLDNLPNKPQTIAAVYTIAQGLQTFSGHPALYYAEWKTRFKTQFPQLFKDLSPAQIYFFALINYAEKMDPMVTNKNLGALFQ